MGSVKTFQTAELQAPTAELRSMLAEMRREIDILRRRDALRETQLGRVRSELERAAGIQRQLGGQWPRLRSAHLESFNHPVDRVSGDLHFANRTSPTTVSFGVADATGHGLAAGLISSAVKGMLDAALSTPRACGEVLDDLNRQLLSYAFPDCEFVTALLAEYDESTRVLRWARAGGPPPVLIPNGSSPRRLKGDGLPLGVEPACRFETCQIALQPGDAIILHTDGLEALHKEVTGSRNEADFLRWVRSNAARFDPNDFPPRNSAAHPAPDDDITVVVLRIDRA